MLTVVMNLSQEDVDRIQLLMDTLNCSYDEAISYSIRKTSETCATDIVDRTTLIPSCGMIGKDNTLPILH